MVCLEKRARPDSALHCVGDTFPCGNESQRALRLQADDGFRWTCELYSWQSHEAEVRTMIRSQQKRQAQDLSFLLAENQRFELWNRVTGYTISNRAPSTN